MSEWGQDPAQEQGSRTATVGALLCFTAAALTVIGLVQTLFTATISFDTNTSQRTTLTSWTYRAEPIGMPINGESHPAIIGGPLTLAVLILVVGAAGLLVARGRPAARLGPASRLAAVIGATFLAATVCAVGIQELFWLDVYSPSGGPRQVELSVTESVGPGLWSLVTGAVVGLVAAVVSWRSGRQEPSREEPETPRLGIPVVVRRLPDEPPPDQDAS